PTELIAPPCCWSRIIGIVRSESTVFKTKTIVRRKFKQDAIFITAMGVSLAGSVCNHQLHIGNIVEELSQGGRMSPTFSKFEQQPAFAGRRSVIRHRTQ
ncbi:hypothetical protein, partial [Yersinia proxima]|uniref:hypothetical protein n=1 Tax=Yersinia proxima TaxID=2890316 RepID=UPI001D11C74B